jgi:hypothetical protein
MIPEPLFPFAPAIFLGLVGYCLYIHLGNGRPLSACMSFLVPFAVGSVDYQLGVLVMGIAAYARVFLNSCGYFRREYGGKNYGKH